jgi:peptide/nickel transport system substrate-binding protein
VLERNPDYWQEGLPRLDKVIFREISDSTVATANMATGDVDIYPFVDAKQVPALASIPGVDVEVFDGGLHFWMALNQEHPPFTDEALRWALYYAIDVDAIVDVAFRGYGAPMRGTVPSLHWAFDPDAAPPPIGQDLDKAREYLAQAGSPDGFSFRLAVGGSPILRQVAEIIQASVADVGIEVEVNFYEQGAFFEIVRNDHDAADAQVGGITPLWPNPEFYFQFYRCGAFSLSGYCNEELDALWLESQGTMDITKRRAIVQQMNQIIYRDLPQIPLASGKTIIAVNTDRVQGFGPDGFSRLAWRWLWVKQD